MKRRLLDGYTLEWLAFIFFMVTFCAISYCHEPWFDEAQAWLIARDASYKEMLFVLPHYECHPPLWHLILSIPAKLGVPFELGLKSVGIIISTVSAALLIFRSKLPRLMRLLLPFSYFFFYQHGVIVRPYGLMLLTFILLGMEFPKRNERPWRTALLLMLLCLTSAYGILLAGGISICIVWELWREKGINRLFRDLFRDPRTKSLFALLVLAILLILQIRPRQETYAIELPDKNSGWLCLLVSLFTFPAECLLTTASWFKVDTSLLQTVSVNPLELIPMCVVGVLLWAFILCASSRKNLKFLLAPYALFALFAAWVYFAVHHVGVVWMLLLFWWELLSQDENRFEIGKALMLKLVKEKKDEKLLRGLYGFMCAVCLIIPLYWSSAASVNEIKSEFNYSRSIAQFLKSSNLEKTLILAPWRMHGSKVPGSEGKEDYINTCVIGTPVPINTYFDSNLFFVINNGDPKKSFIYNRCPSYAESLADQEKWREAGVPDVIIGKPELELLYGDDLSYSDYSLVKVFNEEPIWKSFTDPSIMPIWLRNDLLEKYHLEPITDIQYYWLTGDEFVFTDEMQEAYESGVPIEEILDPVLDKMFGDIQGLAM